MNGATGSSCEQPRTLAAAVQAMAVAEARVLAGGTDLMVELQTGRSRVERVVDLSCCSALRYVRAESGGLRLGAMTTCADLLADARIAAAVPMLRAVALAFAAEQIRSRATIGGNLATASPAADLAPALLALDAQVRLQSTHGARDVPLCDFFVGYRRHAGRADELLESVFVPGRPPGEQASFEKVGTRAAQAIAKVSVALAVTVEAGRWMRLGAAAGAVADRPVRLPSLQVLVGTAPDAAAIAAAASAAARHDCAPIDDVRSTAHYRRHALQRLLLAMLGAVRGGS